eukprot:5109503-Prymnesium_polylepis.1
MRQCAAAACCARPTACRGHRAQMKNGIEVCDKDGNKIGLSVAAGKIAVFKTVTTCARARGTGGA